MMIQCLGVQAQDLVIIENGNDQLELTSALQPVVSARKKLVLNAVNAESDVSSTIELRSTRDTLQHTWYLATFKNNSKNSRKFELIRPIANFVGSQFLLSRSNLVHLYSATVSGSASGQISSEGGAGLSFWVESGREFTIALEADAPPSSVFLIDPSTHHFHQYLILIIGLAISLFLLMISVYLFVLFRSQRSTRMLSWCFFAGASIVFVIFESGGIRFAFDPLFGSPPETLVLKPAVVSLMAMALGYCCNSTARHSQIGPSLQNFLIALPAIGGSTAALAIVLPTPASMVSQVLFVFGTLVFALLRYRRLCKREGNSKSSDLLSLALVGWTSLAAFSLYFDGEIVSVAVMIGLLAINALTADTMRQLADHLVNEKAKHRRRSIRTQASKQLAEGGIMEFSNQANIVPSKLEFFAEEAETAELIEALYHSIERGEINVVYRPVLSGPRDLLVGFEAGLEWTPAGYEVFLWPEIANLAAEDPILMELDRFILDVAITQIATVRQANPEFANLVLICNVSPQCFQDPMLAAEVIRLTNKNRLMPSSLIMQIDGNTLDATDEHISAVLNEMGRLQFGLSIGSFGLGSADLLAVQNIHLTQVGLDECWLRGATSSDRHQRALLGLFHFLAGQGVKPVFGSKEVGQLLDRNFPSRTGLAKDFLFLGQSRSQNLAEVLQRHIRPNQLSAEHAKQSKGLDRDLPPDFWLDPSESTGTPLLEAVRWG